MSRERNVRAFSSSWDLEDWFGESALSEAALALDDDRVELVDMVDGESRESTGPSRSEFKLRRDDMVVQVKRSG